MHEKSRIKSEITPVESPSGCSSWSNSTGQGSRKREFGIRKKMMNANLGLRFRTTCDIIEAAEKGLLPDKIMLNTHPQRWDDRFGPWVRPSEPLLRRMPSACFTG